LNKHFTFLDTALSGLIKIERKVIEDNRGYFSRSYCREELAELGCNDPISQANYTITKKMGSIRGMHFQYPPYSEEKIITCLRGIVIDVVVDIRKDSPTFLQWHAEELSEDNYTSLYVPSGFAHGFQTLTNNCQLLYFHTNSYVPESEGSLNPFDPMVNIEWPLKVSEISERDSNTPNIYSTFRGI